MVRKIDYNARNFADVRDQLVGFIQQYYPEIFSDFNDASVGMMLLELNAAVGDMLSYHTDRMFNETQINYAQERSSLLELARTFGLNIPGRRPSISVVDWSVTVPTLGDTFDIQYAPKIIKGSQATGAGKVFELMEDCDFSSPFTTGGIPNRLIIPNRGSTNEIINYTLVKREIVLNGFTKIYKKIVERDDYKPFNEIVLPDDNVISIENIITKEGTNYNDDPSASDWENFDNNWYEVPALAQAQIYTRDVNKMSDNSSIIPGKWVNAPQRFIKEYTDNGFCKIIFGGGQADVSALNDFIGCRGQIDRIGNLINNNSLGTIPNPSNTMFIKYRVGGGESSNIGPNVLTNLGVTEFVINGDDPSVNTSVRNSLTVNNPIPALGGAKQLSINQIRNLVRYNFSAQDRCVTIKDYQSRITLMPGKFGVPFRTGVWEERNKINVTILALDENNKLTTQSTATLKQNIAEYLADYRMINDYVTIKNGQVINLSYEVDLYVEKTIPKGEIIGGVAQSITEYMDINKWDMGDNIYLSQLIENINNVPGVLNVTDLRVYNKVNENGKYSLNEIAQPLLDTATRQIDLLGKYTLFGVPNGMFEVKYPNKDIKISIST
tara:strand:- start:26771 stop:28594 length:1824 start_codon:yes stop_codon:yes gene_type:complete